ncbi:hypothetical protein ACF07Y_29150 [Streptomyces sp. NPDC016566]|uniref:hypothetical protein n=1 Tax=Streptomyces sp. NPDC016566 TaxID=3364967 RepID=UPI0036F64C89
MLGTAVQLPLVYLLSGLGLPGVGPAMALAMAARCGAVAVLFRRARRQEAEVSLAGAG